jgi:hypothetical protein
LINGTKYDIISEYAAEYSVGERALFFIYRSDDNSALESSGVTSKFTINESDGTVQSLQLERTKEDPMKLSDFRNDIEAEIAKGNATSTEK